MKQSVSAIMTDSVAKSSGILVPCLLAWFTFIGIYIHANDEGSVASDRAALVSLYQATSGTAWWNSTNWDTSEPLNTWHGVKTNEDGRVISLDLNSNNLHGEIPDAIGELVMLLSLKLRENELSGPIPRTIGNLTSLEELILSHNTLTGYIPSEIGNLSGIRRLHLGNNRLGGPIPEQLGNLSSATLFNLSTNRLGGSLPKSIGNLTSVRHFIVSENSLLGEIPSTIGDMRSLIAFNIRGNAIKGRIPEEIGQLVNLRNLVLSANRLRGEVPGTIGELTELRQIHLTDNFLSGELPQDLSKLSLLEWLLLGDNLFTGQIPPWITDLENLEWLELSYNRFYGEIPNLVFGRQFHSLALNDNQLTGEIPVALAANPGLNELRLGNNQLTGEIPDTFTDLTGLWSIDVAGNDICVQHDAEELRTWLQNLGYINSRIPNCPNPYPFYLMQSVQSLNTPTPLVASRDALLRVFLASEGSVGLSYPVITATFYDRQGNELYQANPTTEGQIREKVEEGSMEASANVLIPGEFIQPGVQIKLDIDGELPGLPQRIPKTGLINLDISRPATLNLMFVPLIAYNDMHSATHFIDTVVDQGEAHAVIRKLTDLLPISNIELSAHEPVIVNSYASDYEKLRQVTAIRSMAGDQGYWQGVSGPVKHTGKNGLAWTDVRASYSDPDPETMAHEIGHNMGLSHAPCGGANGHDRNFPSPRGEISAWGYNRQYNFLLPPSTPDYMSYCGPSWTSEYSYSLALGHRLRTEKEDDTQVTSQVLAKQQTLLLWGGVNEAGEPYLRPSFFVKAIPNLPTHGDEYQITGENEDGILFSVSFNMPVLLDAPEQSAFVMTLPVDWQGRLENIRLTNGEKETTMGWNTLGPMSIMLDENSGQVRGFLNTDAIDALGFFPNSSKIRVLESNGIPIDF